MNNTTKTIAVVALALLFLACGSPKSESAATAAGDTASTSPAPTQTTAPAADHDLLSASSSASLTSIDPLNVLAIGVRRVEPNKVCMVNERYMADDQIPVNVGGKTYYGCCAMCETALEQDASKRTAIDPVSKRPVDKAGAVIGADEKGRVYYFENERNLHAFTPPA